MSTLHNLRTGSESQSRGLLSLVTAGLHCPDGEGPVHRTDAVAEGGQSARGGRTELKVDGCRAVAFKTGGKVHLRPAGIASRRAFRILVKDSR